jgi:hypothetical protein
MFSLDLHRLLIEIAGADHRLPRRWSIGDHLGAHEKVVGVGAFWPLALGAPAFDVNHLQADGSCQAADDFVLDFQQVGSLDIESFCPKLRSSLRVDELGVDAESFPVGKDAAGQCVTHVEFAADPPHVADPTLVGERGVARNNEASR